MSVTHPVKTTDPDQNYFGQNKITSPALKSETDKSFGNFHANLMNSGQDDNSDQKKSRLSAIKRRMSKPY